jgi:hypothetical protein
MTHLFVYLDGKMVFSKDISAELRAFAELTDPHWEKSSPDYAAYQSIIDAPPAAIGGRIGQFNEMIRRLVRENKQ